MLLILVLLFAVTGQVSTQTTPPDVYNLTFSVAVSGQQQVQDVALFSDHTVSVYISWWTNTGTLTRFDPNGTVSASKTLSSERAQMSPSTSKNGVDVIINGDPVGYTTYFWWQCLHLCVAACVWFNAGVSFRLLI